MFVVLDSPLTTVKQRDSAPAPEDGDEDTEIDPTIEPKFWESMSKTSQEIQIIVLDNKEPGSEISKELNLQLFVGPTAAPDERAGFISDESKA